MSVVTIASEADFKQWVLEAKQPVLVDFWAPWCGPCKMVGPEVEAIAEEYAGKAVVAKVNVDEQQALASQFNVMGIPTLLVFKEGKEKERIVGYRPRKDLMDALDRAE